MKKIFPKLRIKYSKTGEVSGSNKTIFRVTRPCMWFAKNDLVNLTKLNDYYTPLAIAELLKYEYLEVVEVLRFDAHELRVVEEFKVGDETLKWNKSYFFSSGCTVTYAPLPKEFQGPPEPPLDLSSARVVFLDMSSDDFKLHNPYKDAKMNKQEE